MYKNLWCTYKVVVLLIKPIFFTFSLRSRRWILKSLVSIYKYDQNHFVFFLLISFTFNSVNSEALVYMRKPNSKGFEKRPFARWRHFTIPCPNPCPNYQVTKFFHRLSFSVHHIYPKISCFLPVSSIRNILDRSVLSAHFLFWGNL